MGATHNNMFLIAFSVLMIVVRDTSHRSAILVIVTGNFMMRIPDIMINVAARVIGE